MSRSTLTGLLLAPSSAPSMGLTWASADAHPEEVAIMSGLQIAMAFVCPCDGCWTGTLSFRHAHYLQRRSLLPDAESLLSGQSWQSDLELHVLGAVFLASSTHRFFSSFPITLPETGDPRRLCLTFLLTLPPTLSSLISSQLSSPNLDEVPSDPAILAIGGPAIEPSESIGSPRCTVTSIRYCNPFITFLEHPIDHRLSLLGKSK